MQEADKVNADASVNAGEVEKEEVALKTSDEQSAVMPLGDTEKTSDAALEEEENTDEADQEKPDPKEYMTVAEKLGDAALKDEEKEEQIFDQAKSDPETMPYVSEDKDDGHEEEDMHVLENSVDAAPEEEESKEDADMEMPEAEGNGDKVNPEVVSSASEGQEYIIAAEKLSDAALKDEEKGEELVLDKSVHAAPEEEDMHAVENSVDAAPEEEENDVRVDQGKSVPMLNDAEMLANESAPKDVEETRDADMLADDASAPDQETHGGGEAGLEDGFKDSYAGSALPTEVQHRHVTTDAQHQSTASPVNC